MTEAESVPYFPRYAHILFCEDVRHESAGQATAIGWFRSHHLEVAAPPPIEAKVACCVQLITPKTEPFKSVRVRVTWKGETIHEMIPDQEEIARMQAQDNDLATHRFALSIDIKLPRLQVDGNGNLRVEVHADDHLLNGTSLVFRFPAVSSSPP